MSQAYFIVFFKGKTNHWKWGIKMNNSDNSTAHISTYYDRQVKNTIPYYECFHKETINLVKVAKNNPKVWLDTGCGTGSLVGQAVNHFDNTLFILADPSMEMLSQAKKKLVDSSQDKIRFLEPVSTQEIMLDDIERPDVITAIQSHHYLSMKDRIKATSKCYDLLEENGIYITFENICPLTPEGIEIGKEYWKQFQIISGKSIEDADKHMKRFGVEYFPITIQNHLSLLKDCGFRVVELFWYSYLQAGFYCIK